MPTLDISRVAFDPRKHYSSVRMQQGRVLTDDDYNEERRIEEEIQRRTQTNIIGGYGSPDNGFKIVDLVNSPAFDFGIHDGAIYLGGIRWEMEKTRMVQAITDSFETVLRQRDWLTLDPANFLLPTADNLPAGIRYDLVYLHAWQQPVCAVEDPTLFEVALGGPDTTTRLRNMRRVKIFPDTGSSECAISWKQLRTNWETNHLGTVNAEYERIPNIKMSVSFSDAQPAPDLCSPSIAGGYLGAENQAIRVQLTSKNAFTWGFDNAAPLYRVQIAEGDKTVTMINRPKDQYHWPTSGQVVELLACDAILPNDERIAAQSGLITRVNSSYSPDTFTFTIEDALPADFGKGWLPASGYLYLRVWNRGADLNSPNEIPFSENNPVVLGNTGLQVTFSRWSIDRDMDAVREDLWVITARPETPNVIVPKEYTTGIRPMGVRSYYAPLAIIEWTLNSGKVEGKIIHDCRRHFRPLTEQECCCTYTVGDGINSKGDFQSIQDAIDSLPDDGGKICVLAGVHEASVSINKLQKIHISGCGEQTIVRAPENSSSPIFTISNSQRIRIDNLTLFTLKGIAILVSDSVDSSIDASEGITIRDNRILALVHAVRVDTSSEAAGDNNIMIIANQIGMYDLAGSDVAIFSLADGVLIEHNRIVRIAAPPVEVDPKTPTPKSPEDPFDPCAGLKKTYERIDKFRKTVFVSLQYIAHFIPFGMIKDTVAVGGIQIAGGSERVKVLNNEIYGGKGNGITLGHERPDSAKVFSAFLYDITIQSNTIREMGLSGIGTVMYPLKSEKSIAIHIGNLLIFENDIKYCVKEILTREDRVQFNIDLPVSGISLAMCEDCIIRENWIEANGINQPQPVCGIFIMIAEKVDIMNNRVVDNGPATIKESPQNASPRSGICVLFAFKLPKSGGYTTTGTGTNTSGLNEFISSQDTVPAVRIHDNIVSQPLGQALSIIALGAISVVSNQFTSQGIYKGQGLSQRAGAVYILDVGLSKDLINILIPVRNWQYVSPAVVLGLAGTQSPQSLIFALLLQLFPTGKVMFSSNQTVLDMRSADRDIALSSQLIYSWDDISFVNNQSECCGLIAASPHAAATFDIVLFNTALLAPTVRCNDNRFTDGYTLTLFSLVSLAFVNTAVSNQSTHCLVVPFWIFRRKFLNIELNNLACRSTALESNLSKHNIYSTNEQFNFVKF